MLGAQDLACINLRFRVVKLIFVADLRESLLDAGRMPALPATAARLNRPAAVVLVTEEQAEPPARFHADVRVGS